MIEVIVSAALLSAVLVTFTGSITSAYLSIINSGERTQALGIARERMEQLKALGYDELLEEAYEIGNDFELFGVACTQLNEVEGYEKFLERFCITEKTRVVNDYNVEGLELNIEVYYQDRKRSIVLTSFVAAKRI